MQSRRVFFGRSIAWCHGVVFALLLLSRVQIDAGMVQANEVAAVKTMKLGLVTYNWGADWDLPTLLANCKEAKLDGVELRVDHRHGVSPKLSAAERQAVKKQFLDSGVQLVGFGTNFNFHSPNPATLRQNIDGAKEYIQLARDCGAMGVKVKPDALPKEVAPEVTIAQIAAALCELGKYAEEFNQEVRLEIHGGCAAIPVIKAIIDQVPNKNVGLCWNCNVGPDLAPPGLKENFASVQGRLSRAVHIRDLASKSYPTREFFDLLRAGNYGGFLLIEEGDTTLDAAERLRRLTQSAELFREWSASPK